MNRPGGACSICSHPERADIDKHLAELTPLRKLSKRYGMSIAALSNHRAKHSNKTEIVRIKRARAGARADSPLTVLQRIEDGLKNLETLMEKSPDHQYLLAYREWLRTLEIIGKIKGEFSEAPNVTINLWQTPVWQQIRVVIFEELESHPQIRAALAKRLLSLEEHSEGLAS